VPLDPSAADYFLLRDTPLNVFRDAEALAGVVAQLTALGYRIINVDASGGSLADCFRQMADAIPEWPDRYVVNLDGLDNGLRDLEGTAFAVVLNGFASLQKASRRDAARLLNVLVTQAWWHLAHGRPLLTLVQTDPPIKGDVGRRARLWWGPLQVEDDERA
jgi:hypothetical protein